MYPEVPIALRMSGHLLLGVVRIYSKQVDYLYEDCNGVRNTINRVFTSVNVNLPDDATHAPFHAITLPEKFELDSLELDDYDKDLYVFAEDFSSFFTSYERINSEIHIFRCEDSHLKSKDEITLSALQYDFRASSFMEDNSRSGPVPMAEDIPHVEVDAAAGSDYPSPPNQLAADDRNIGNNSPQDLPSIEIMRDARHGFDFNNSPILPDRVDPDKFLEEQINKDKATCTPVTEGVLLPDDRFSSPQNHEEQHSLRHLDSPMLFVHQSPEMEIQPTPPAAQRIVRKRKRKQYFDKSPVLSNKFDCSAGCCSVLLSLYEEGEISVHHMVTTEKTPQKTSVDQAPSPRHDYDGDIEVLRNNEGASPDRFMPSFSTAVPSPHGRSYFTPENSSLGLQSERLETTEGDGVLPTDMGTSPRDLDSEMRTPDTFYGKGLPERTALSDIPEMVSSAEELGFLDHDDNSPAGSQGTPEVGIFSYNQGTPELQALSSRTRAVAQYLKKQSSITPTSELTRNQMISV
ncbi:UNVERIFIED_CONTAM: Sister chromatid cohesion 1 protein 3 [Sesamum radiatum]|uniref:Sister chromatid cohesion 1 protein 3 n=1 Tax=Sesamum radiatum TaxID=300843 RepID=A0AAW2VSU4_SESRA